MVITDICSNEGWGFALLKQLHALFWSVRRFNYCSNLIISFILGPASIVIVSVTIVPSYKVAEERISLFGWTKTFGAAYSYCSRCSCLWSWNVLQRSFSYMMDTCAGTNGGRKVQFSMLSFIRFAALSSAAETTASPSGVPMVLQHSGSSLRMNTESA